MYAISGQDNEWGETQVLPSGCAGQIGTARKGTRRPVWPRFAAGGLVVSYPKNHDFISIFDPAGSAAAVKSFGKTAPDLPSGRLV